MINGILNLNRDINLQKIKQSIFRIIVVFTIWKFITVIIFIIKFGIKDFKFYDIFTLIFSYSLPYVSLNHFWFIYVLVSIYFSMPLSKFIYEKIRDKKGLVLILPLCLPFILNLLYFILKIISYNTTDFNVYIDHINYISPFNQEFSFALSYFIFGAYLYNKLCTLSKKKLKKIKIITIILLFIAWCILVCIGVSTTNMYKSLYIPVFSEYSNIFVFIMSASLVIIFFGVDIKNKIIKRTVITISENTLGIYFIHWIVLYFINISKFSILMNTVVSLLTLLISLAIALIIKKIPVIKLLLRI